MMTSYSDIRVKNKAVFIKYSYKLVIIINELVFLRVTLFSPSAPPADSVNEQLNGLEVAEGNFEAENRQEERKMGLAKR